MNAMKENPLLEKSLHFAARIVKLYQHLSLINDCLEIKRILIASLKTAKEPK